MITWDQNLYQRLHTSVFRSDYAGYRPTVKEIPNGDGAVDVGKRFAHIAAKYQPDAFQREVFAAAFSLAWTTAQEIGVPAAFAPDPDYSCLRILEYPPGTTTAPHCDFDLFTLNLYRNQPERLIADVPRGAMHMGEIGEMIGLGPATKHSVVPSMEPQYSIVFFAIPDHAAVLPTGVTVGEWLTERIARSRVY